MKQYYFTVAVLPTLSMEEEPFFTKDSYLEHCEAFVDPGDLAYISAGSLFLEEPHVAADGTALGTWNTFLSEFQAESARMRASDLGWESEELPATPGRDVHVQELARQVTAEENPYRAEMLLLRYQWDLLEELELGHFFDREKLLLYYLKLQIVLRRHILTDRDAGTAEFTRQYERVAQAMMEIVE